MSKVCPLDGIEVLYPECNECGEREKCRAGELSSVKNSEEKAES